MKYSKDNIKGVRFRANKINFRIVEVEPNGKVTLLNETGGYEASQYITVVLEGLNNGGYDAVQDPDGFYPADNLPQFTKDNIVGVKYRYKNDRNYTYFIETVRDNGHCTVVKTGPKGGVRREAWNIAGVLRLLNSRESSEIIDCPNPKTKEAYEIF
jgi:hypothetical protein